MFALSDHGSGYVVDLPFHLFLNQKRLRFVSICKVSIHSVDLSIQYTSFENVMNNLPQLTKIIINLSVLEGASSFRGKLYAIATLMFTYHSYSFWTLSITQGFKNGLK